MVVVLGGSGGGARWEWGWCSVGVGVVLSGSEGGVRWEWGGGGVRWEWGVVLGESGDGSLWE